jgi:hypothetical protein
MEWRAGAGKQRTRFTNWAEACSSSLLSMFRFQALLKLKWCESMSQPDPVGGEMELAERSMPQIIYSRQVRMDCYIGFIRNYWLVACDRPPTS